MLPTRHRITVGALVLAATVIGCTPDRPAQAQSPAAPQPATATVLRVVDGDTIAVDDDVRGRLKVRILGIDAPESQKRGYTIGCYGPEAATYARTQLDGRRVALVLDPTQGRTDRYGRTLAHVVREDGYDYGTEAARAGNVKSYVYDRRPSSHADAIAEAQQQAQDAGAGLWGPPCHGDTASVPS